MMSKNKSNILYLLVVFCAVAVWMEIDYGYII